LAGAVFGGVLGWRFGVGALPTWWLAVPLIIGWFAVPLIAADLAHHRLPDVFTFAAYPLLGGAIAVAAFNSGRPSIAVAAMLGVLGFGGVHGLAHAWSPNILGAGDVKLAGSLGAVLGALGWAAVAIAATVAAIITLLLALLRRSRRAPHGPGLLISTWLVATFPGPLLPGAG
jgi:leader peptidase (prepilin peptidase)/N-methyltransferase